VTANALLVLVGSALVLALGVFVLFAMYMAMTSAPLEPRPAFPFSREGFKAFLLLIPLIYILPAVWGICTGVGLLQLKNWARISIIVFAGLLIVFGLLGGLSALALIMTPSARSPQLNRDVFTLVRAVTAVFAVGQVGLGIWWMGFFNLARTKVQFQHQLVPWTALPAAGPLPPLTPPPPRTTESDRPTAGDGGSSDSPR
jgi:hypothetical protein